MNDLGKSDLEAIGASGANASSEPMSIVVFEEESQFTPVRRLQGARLPWAQRPDILDALAAEAAGQTAARAEAGDPLPVGLKPVGLKPASSTASAARGPVEGARRQDG